MFILCMCSLLADVYNMLGIKQVCKMSSKLPTCIHDLLGLAEGRHGGVWDWHGVLALSRLHRVILFPIIVGVKELLKPLNILKIVLKFALHQFVNWDNLMEKTTKY